MSGQDRRSADDSQRLTDLRGRIDRLDAALVYILAERFTCTEEIGHLKCATDLPALDEERETAQKARLHQLAQDAGVSFDIVAAVFDTITGRVRARHDEIRADR